MAFIRGYALIIGIGTYQYEPWLNVPLITNDAHAVATVLCDPHFCGYPTEQVTLLTNHAASRVATLDALRDLATRTSPDDTVVLFYSGHGGYSVNRSYYLTAYDTQVRDRKIVGDTAVSQHELIEHLRAVPAKQVLLLLNTCHAGQLTPALGDINESYIGKPLPQQTADALLATGSGRIIITACREDQVSYIGSGSFTVFAQALIAGLRGQGLVGKAGFISAFDLYTHLYFAVVEAVEQHIPIEIRQQYSQTQEPELTILKGVGSLPIALYRGATLVGDFRGDHLPPDGTAVRQISLARSQWAFQQSISGSGAVGTVGPGNNSSVVKGNNNTIIQSGQNTVQYGGQIYQAYGDFIYGDKIGGDKINGDKIIVGDINNSSGIAIGQNARSNIQSILNTASQRISTISHGNIILKSHLQALLIQLSVELQKTSVEQSNEAEAVAELARKAVEQATSEQQNSTLLKISSDALEQVAKQLSLSVPSVLPITTQILEILTSFS